jgi:hypothetical protein
VAGMNLKAFGVIDPVLDANTIFLVRAHLLEYWEKPVVFHDQNN